MSGTGTWRTWLPMAAQMCRTVPSTAGLGKAPPSGPPDKVAGLPNLPARVRDESGALAQGQV
eukprot:4349007-Amphidinium_carterae.1